MKTTSKYLYWLVGVGPFLVAGVILYWYMNVYRPYYVRPVSTWSNQEIVAYMGPGGGTYERESRDTRTMIPEDFWGMPPRDAAKELLEANRRTEHKEYYAVTMPNEGAVTLPECWTISYHTGSAHGEYGGDYVLQSSKEGASLTYIGSSYWRPWSLDLRRINVEREVASQIAEVMLWIENAKTTPRNQKKIELCSTFPFFVVTTTIRMDIGGMMTTGDSSNWTMFRDRRGQVLIDKYGRGCTDGIPQRWGEELGTASYHEDVRCHFYALLMERILLDRCGDDWKCSSKTLPYTEGELKQIKHNIKQNIVDWLAGDPSVSIRILNQTIVALGMYGFHEFEPTLKDLEKKLMKVPFKDVPGKMSSVFEDPKNVMEGLLQARMRLAAFNDIEQLRKLSKDKVHSLSRWAGDRLRHDFPFDHIAELRRTIATPNGGWPHVALTQLIHLYPDEAKEVCQNLPKATYSETAVPAIEYLNSLGIPGQAERERELFRISSQLDFPPYARGKAIALLADSKMPNLDVALIVLTDGKEIPPIVLSEVSLVLAKRRAVRYFDRVSRFLEVKSDHKGDIFEALRIMVQDDPASLKPKMERIILEEAQVEGWSWRHLEMVWSADLRGLKAELLRMATKSPNTEKTDGSKSRLAHLSRKILRLWATENTVEKAKLMIAFGVDHMVHSSDGETEWLRRLTEIKKGMTETQRVHVATFIQWYRNEHDSTSEAFPVSQSLELLTKLNW